MDGIKKDCIFFNSEKSCGALKQLYCKECDCKFYKSKREWIFGPDGAERKNPLGK